MIKRIEIDKEALLRYKQRQGQVVFPLIFAAMFIVLGALVATPGENTDRYATVRELWTALGICTAAGGVFGTVIGMLVQYWSLRRYARRFTDAYRVSVEGPYLRIITHGVNYLDQRIHFRNLDNYAIYQSPAMCRAGMKCIRIDQASQLTNSLTRTIEILAPVTPEQTRDELAMIDYESESLPG